MLSNIIWKRFAFDICKYNCINTIACIESINFHEVSIVR